MSILLTIIAVVIIFSVVVLIHEYGHFAAARRAGIRVLEFGLGFPPRLFKKRIGETLYSINAIPIGGFVKLHGEDAHDEKNIKDPRSFAHKSPWTRTKVIVAGVFMNIVLAIVLLTVGFSFGIEPLLVTEDDLFTHIEQGNVLSAPGVFVSKANDHAKAFGLNEGDSIIALDDRPIVDPDQLVVFQKDKAGKDIDLTVRNSGGAVERIHVPLPAGSYSYGISLRPYTLFPRLVISEVQKGGASARAGLLSGDAIIKMNDREVYSPADFEEELSRSALPGKVKFAVLRNGGISEINVDLQTAAKVVLAEVFIGSAADRAGFQKGDIVLSVDGQAMSKPEDVQKILKDNPDKEMWYKLIRGGREIELRSKTGENKMLGVALSSIIPYQNLDVSFYRGTVLTSITEIKRVRYAPWTAFKQAISESIRLTGLTITAFGRTIMSVFSKFAVPDDVGGPVQIAYYTHTFIKEGFFALLRFTALLSLSLAVINILPIPALDGGRFLFILIEMIRRKKVNARIESIVHGIGFFLLLALIALVTFSDIAKLF